MAAANPSMPLVTCGRTLREVMRVIDEHALGIALLVDDAGRLIATITDGDVRRAILAGTSLEMTIESLPRFDRGPALTAPSGTQESELIRMMTERGVRHIPLLDDAGRVCSLSALSQLVQQRDLPLRGVIMAGGFGKRLQPLTNATPKPMLPVNGRPLLEHILVRLRDAGIRNVNVATHYLGDTIKNHFKDGSDLGVRLQYVHESQPLGTAGALGLLEHSPEPLLVINGDILTGIDFRSMHDFHVEHGAQMTVAVRQYDIEVPYGVVETSGVDVTGIAEKPVLRHFVNAGIYLIDASVCRWVPADSRLDMTDLIARVLKEGGRVISFPVREYWIDVGQIEQYERAAADAARGAV